MSTTDPILLKVEDSNGKRIVTLIGEGPWIIGRDPTCEVEIADHRASRRHARLISTSQGLVIEDLASSNGTLLDGRSIEGRAPFPGSSTLKIGDVLIRSKKPTANPTRKPGSDRSRRSATTKTSSNSKNQRSQNTSNHAPTPRTTRTTRKEASPVGNLLLLLFTIGSIGYFVSQLGPTPQELPPEIGVAAVKPATGQPGTNLQIPLPSAEPKDVPKVQGSDAVSSAIDRPNRPVTSGFTPDANFEVSFEPAVDDVAPTGGEDRVTDDQVSDVQTVPTPDDGKLQLRILDEAWPPSDRIIAYQFHQKDHHGGPDFIDRRGKELKRLGSGSRKGFRVIALEVDNSTTERQLVQLKTPLRNDLEMRFRVDPGLSLRRYLAIEDPGDQPVLVEMLDEDGELLDSVERVLLPGRSSESAKEAKAIAREREREEWVREKFRLRPISVEVRDEVGKPVAGGQTIAPLQRESGGRRGNHGNRWTLERSGCARFLDRHRPG